ncbi:RHS repeat-associated core domain-containing protein [Burkholderia sp. ABCPW 14]|uniref:RHS repeat-associated core domain-containing protein n=1 Tax=Burkholderia sp. ABCPW 14 TaxID=1637860 RepID=UPI0009EAFD28|nr:RHS repeat-associated core domain-containing protein [Burkholderia sp. ABCPW 14]
MALPAVKHLDPVVGVDVHSVIVTPGLPPVFLPHPHIGFMLDLREYVEAAKGVIGSIAMAIAEDAVLEYLKDHPDDVEKLTDTFDSLDDQMKKVTSNPMIAEALKLNRDVSSIKGDAANAMGAGVGAGATAGRPIFVNGLMRATAGTHSFHVPGLHFPLGETFAPPDPLPSDDAESYMGSRTVLANNDPFSYMALSAMSCWAEGIEPPPHNGAHTARTHLSMPSSVMLPIPAGRPVLIGGPPVMNMAAAAKGMFKAFQGSKWAKKLADKLHLKSGFLRCTVLKAEPVDVTTGEVVLQQNDFTVSGRLPLVWDRYYASHDRHAGAVGFGWQTPADIRLELMRNEDGIGAAAYFPDHATAFDVVPAGDGWPARTYDWQHGHALYCDDGRMVLRTREGIEYGFVLPSRWRDAVAALDSESRLTLPIDRMADLNGNAWVFERDVYGGLVRLVEWKCDGQTERLVECGTGRGLHAGLLTSLTLIDAGGNAHPLVSYEHDRERNLAAAIDAMAHPHHFEYAAGHRMVSHTSARGVSFYYSYQLGDDGVWRVDHAWGDNGLFDYRFVYDRARMETRVTNSLGHTTVTQMNERGMPVAEVDPLGGVTGYRYDAQGRTSAVIDSAGRTTAWEYDAYGSLIVQTLPDGSAIRVEYNANQRPVCVTAPVAWQWRYSWDERGNLLAQATPSRATRYYEYDPHGKLVAHTGARGAVTRFGYDRDGNLEAITDALGHRTLYAYDACANVIRITDALNQVSRYEYDRNGNLTRAIEPGGRETSCSYDVDGNLTRYVGANGRVTQFEYSALGRVKKRLMADAGMVEYRYDTEEQLIGVVNECGELYQLKRDALGRIVEEIDYWGEARRYEYGSMSELLRSIDPLGRTIDYETDVLGRIVKKRVMDRRQPDGIRTETFSYDRVGNLIAAKNPDRRVEFTYDAAGRVMEERQGDDFTIANVYDAGGNRIERWTRLDTRCGVITHAIRYEYDELDAITSIQIDDAAPVTFERDAIGQIRIEHLGAELRRELSYTSDGLLAKQALLGGTSALFASEYEYDVNGEMTGKCDSRLGTERFEYDPTGKLISHLDPTGTLHRFLYDAAGNLLKTRIRQGDRTNAVGQDQRVDTWVREGEYDGCYYAFDRVGNLIRKRDARQDLMLRWDGDGLLIETLTVRQPPAAGEISGGTVSIRTRFAYDTFRRRIKKSTEIWRDTGSGPEATSDWTSLSRVGCFFWDGDALASEITYGNRMVDRLLSNTDPDTGPPQLRAFAHAVDQTAPADGFGGVREWVYYPGTFRPLVEMRYMHAETTPPLPSASESATRHFFHTDPNGAPTRITDSLGAVVWEGKYAAWGRTNETRVRAELDQPLRFQGQFHDVETGLHYNRHRYYDTHIGNFISQDAIRLLGGLNLYQFALNPLSWIDPLGLNCRSGFKRFALNEIWKDHDHPLRFLLARDGSGKELKKFVETLGKNAKKHHELMNWGDAEDDLSGNVPVFGRAHPTVQMGHLTSNFSLDLSAGDKERLALEDAWVNQNDSQTGERYEVIFEKKAVTIGGVPVEKRTAWDWEQHGFLAAGTVDNADESKGWTK